MFKIFISLHLVEKQKKNLAPPPTISRCIPTILGLRTNSQVVEISSPLRVEPQQQGHPSASGSRLVTVTPPGFLPLKNHGRFKGWRKKSPPLFNQPTKSIHRRFHIFNCRIFFWIKGENQTPKGKPMRIVFSSSNFFPSLFSGVMLCQFSEGGGTTATILLTSTLSGKEIPHDQRNPGCPAAIFRKNIPLKNHPAVGKQNGQQVMFCTIDSIQSMAGSCRLCFALRYC